MKSTTSKPGGRNVNTGKKTHVDVRDNLDSRKNEEQDDKGDDFTHNKKETKSEKLKSKKD